MNHKTIYWVTFFLSLIVIVLNSVLSFSSLSFFDEKKVVQSGVLIITSLIFAFFISRQYLTGLSQKVKVTMLLFVLLLFVSSSLSSLPEWAFLQTSWYLLLGQLLFLYVFLYQSDKKQFLQTLLVGLFLLGVIYTCRVYADYIIGSMRDYWTTWPQQRNVKIMYQGVNIYPSGFLNFAHVRFFNHLQTWSLPLLIFGYLYYKDKIIPGLRYLLLFFISSWWMLVFAADARGTMLSSAVSLLVVGIVFKKQLLPFLKIYGTTALAGLALYIVLFLLPATEAREIMTRFGDSGRLKVWLFSLEQIANNPWLGLGPMHFSYMGNDPPWSTPHNLLLQSAAEWGLPAVFLFGGLCLYAYYRFVRQSFVLSRKETDSMLIYLRIALLASITAALVHSMFSGIFNSSLSQLLGAIILAAGFGEYYRYEGKSFYVERQKRSLALYVLMLVLLINTSYVGYKVASDIPKLEERKTDYMQRYRSLTLYPRFWNQGMIYEREEGTKENGEKETGSDGPEF